MTQKKVKPRWVPDKDTRYMAIAFWVSRCSKDPSSPIGAVIVSSYNTPLGWGFNGPPPQIKDDSIDWSRRGKKGKIRHAEKNAIAFSHGMDLRGSTMYVTGHPCTECLGDALAAGIGRICYFPIKHPDPSSVFNGTSLAEEAKEYMSHLKTPGILRLDEFKGDLNWMRDEIEDMKRYGVF